MTRFILKIFPFNLNRLFWHKNVNKKDRIFLIILISKHATEFFEYLNCQYSNIKFILEVEEMVRAQFLKLKLQRKQ